jgi:OOP family OmpA-OmpF porin
MVKKFQLSILCLFVSTLIYSQDIEKINSSEKSVSENNVKEFNRHSLSFDIGGKDGIRYAGMTSTKITQLNSYVLSYRYMFNNRFGIAPEIGWERFKDLRDSIGTGHYMRFSVNTYYNLTDVLRFNSFSSKLGMMAIAGAGYSIGFNPSGVVSLVDTNSISLSGGNRIDGMLHGYFGARVMYKITEKISIHSTIASVFNLRQNRTFDGQRKLGGAGFTGKYYNLTFGASYYFGKEKQHADWYSIADQEKAKYLELNSELIALRKGMEDDDLDGILNAVDEEPNTPNGSIVNNKGITISSSGTNDGSKDFDGDGFLNEVDLCPNLVGTANGCPDADNDGVADFMDACPNVSGSLKFNGCNESDFGISNVVSTNNNLLDENGIYDVLFKFGSAEILESEKIILDRLNKLMNDNKSLKIIVAGHTDKVGSKSYNEELSKRRAENCVKYLVDNGIDSKRLIVEFFSSDQEKYSFNNRELQVANRRVSFKIK